MVIQPIRNSTLADSITSPPRFTRLRNLLLNPLMRSLTIIERDIFFQNSLDLTLTGQQKTVQRLSSHWTHIRSMMLSMSRASPPVLTIISRVLFEMMAKT
jgi:hypothetical protein